MNKAIKLGLLFVFGLAVTACGGGGSDWDEFQPRTATTSDLESRSFFFDWYPSGNPIDPEVGSMTLAFGPFDDSDRTSVSIQEENRGRASGVVDFDSPNLTIHVEAVSGDIDLEVGDEVTVEVQSDVDDGRIRLTNHTTGFSATSK